MAAPQTTQAQGAAPPDIGGIYVIGQKYFLPPQIWSTGDGKTKGNGSLKPALMNPGVDGVLIDLTWSDIAVAYRKYDWSLLDYMARVAVEKEKRFEIAIITGSSTPDWVFKAPPDGYGAQSATFAYIQSGKPGASCLSQTLPLPWDANYHSALRDLLDQLSRHLKKKGYYPNLAMLRITGINTLTDELRLPAAENQCNVDNLQVWQSVGYRPALVRQAWRQVLRLYHRAFPDKVLNVALITANGFPAFTENGIPVASPPAAAKAAQALGNAMTTQLAEEAGQELPAGWFVVQSNGLVLGPQQPDPATISDRRKAHAMLAWQTNEWLGIPQTTPPNGTPSSRGGAACGGTRIQPTPCTASTFARMLTSGIYPNGTTGKKPLQAQYLELFPANVSQFPQTVMQAHDLLMPLAASEPASR
ncbi:MAG TPA: hypothetical protein VGR45_09195 [Stellaceae bacterium]|nr:hypothetical protein [Stellaceae bacterium]